MAERPEAQALSKAVSDRLAFRDGEAAFAPARKVFECSVARASAATSAPAGPQSGNAAGLQIVGIPKTDRKVRNMNETENERIRTAWISHLKE